ncbi:MAG: fibronectin type III-like domain-contianing protein, partial [Candidatus Thorarchaeota archaeon]
VELEAANVGEYTGSDVIQVYFHDVESSVHRPPKELAGFEKVQLGPGEEKRFVVNVKAQDLAFYDVSKHDWLIEPGDFEVLVGRSSEKIDARMDFTYG